MIETEDPEWGRGVLRRWLRRVAAWSRRSLPAIGVGLIAVILAWMEEARGLPLTEAACERYAAERGVLERLGVKEHLARGPAWARANLTDPQLDLIRRYIRIEEALKFRCPERYAILEAKAAREPRRLDVMPPAPARKPLQQDAGTGVTERRTPPPPSAKAGKDRG